MSSPSGMYKLAKQGNQGQMRKKWRVRGVGESNQKVVLT